MPLQISVTNTVDRSSSTDEHQKDKERSRWRSIDKVKIGNIQGRRPA